MLIEAKDRDCKQCTDCGFYVSNYDAYIAGHKCVDKYVEIIKLLTDLKAPLSELKEIKEILKWALGSKEEDK